MTGNAATGLTRRSNIQIDSNSVMVEWLRRALRVSLRASLRFVALGAAVGLLLVSRGVAGQSSTASPTAPVSASQVSGVAPAAASLADLQRMIDRGQATAALAQLDQMAAAEPVPAGVQRLRGLALYSQNKMLEAEQAFAAALEDDPADAMSAQMRGIALYRLGRPKDAIPLLEVASAAAAAASAHDAGLQRRDSADVTVRRDKAPVDPQYVLALCFVDTRRFDDARHAFATQYGFPGDSAAAYLLTARMLLRREYLPVAQDFARKALEIQPQLPLAHRLLGETQLADNHFAEAIAEFEQERKLDPLDPATYDRLGDAYVRQGDFEHARQSLQEAVLLEPNSTGPFILLGKVLLKEQDPAGASAYLEHAREMDPQNYMTHSLLGQAYRQMGRVEDARTETATAEKLQGDNAPKLGDVK